MAKKTQLQQAQEKQTQPQEKKDSRLLYAGPTINNERFFIRKGQIFTTIPRFVSEELHQFFVPLAEYSPEKEKELEKLVRKYLKKGEKK